MTVTAEERLVKWLEHAYAMEKEAETMLATQASRLEHYHILAQRIHQHVAETKEQASAIEGCLRRHDASPPVIKGALASAMAAMHATGTAAMSDEVIKGTIMSYAFEHMEIAVYESLVIAARAAGDVETEDTCRAILEQEYAMASWLSEHLEPTVLQFLERERSDGDAKR